MQTKHLNKVRDMAGCRPGNGSAGRAGGCHVEKRVPAVSPGPFTGFGDVGRACDRWLMKHDPAYRVMRERREAVHADRMERRRKEERP